jgi:bifunctional DNase/RNase
MVEVTVAQLGLDSTSNSYVVVLREKDGARLLPIYIGQPEAVSIVMQMNQEKRERPLTHDLCKLLIVSLGATLTRVCITRVHQNTYFADMQLDTERGRVNVDARPSDSISIALRLDAPIFVEESLLSGPDDESDDFESAPGVLPPSTHELSAEQLKAYLAKLRPEDFGKFTP